MKDLLIYGILAYIAFSIYNGKNGGGTSSFTGGTCAERVNEIQFRLHEYFRTQFPYLSDQEIARRVLNITVV